VVEETRATLLLLTRYYISGSSYIALQINEHLQMRDLSQISFFRHFRFPADRILYRKTLVEAEYASA